MRGILVWTSAPTLALSTTLQTAATFPTRLKNKFSVYWKSYQATIHQLDGVTAKVPPLMHQIQSAPRLRSLAQIIVPMAGHKLGAILTMIIRELKDVVFADRKFNV